MEGYNNYLLDIIYHDRLFSSLESLFNIVSSFFFSFCDTSSCTHMQKEMCHTRLTNTEQQGCSTAQIKYTVMASKLFWLS